MEFNESTQKGRLQQAIYDNLPEELNVEAMKRNREVKPDMCQLCEDEFTTLRLRAKYCKRCTIPVCDTCSMERRQLSKSDKTKYRVCDRCDTELDNVGIIEMQKQVKLDQFEELSTLGKQISKLNQAKEMGRED